MCGNVLISSYWSAKLSGIDGRAVFLHGRSGFGVDVLDEFMSLATARSSAVSTAVWEKLLKVP